MKKGLLYGAAAAAGLVMLAAGLYLAITAGEAEGVMRTLPYVLIGVGCGVFGHGTGSILAERTRRRNPGLAETIEIERNDERNRAIACRAKARAYDLSVYVFGALILAFALLGVETAPVLLLVGAYLFMVGCNVYCQFRYSKEM